MRCRVGDLAIVLKGQKSAGLIVRCVRVLQVGEIVTSKCGHQVRIAEPTRWLLEGLVYRRPSDGVVRLLPVADDSELLPIRDPGDDAVDEMVQKFGKPERVTA